MNSWCESCARKNCCYTMEIRPKCYLPTTNTAHGTPETYLAKSLRYSRDSHEIVEQTENCSEKPNNCETCKHYKLTCDLFSEVCKYEPITQTETQNSNFTFEKRTMLDCYNCKRFETEGECIECEYEPKDEPQTDYGDYERAVEQIQYDMLYESTYNVEDGSM